MTIPREIRNYFDFLEKKARNLEPKTWLSLNFASKNRLYPLNASIQKVFLSGQNETAIVTDKAPSRVLAILRLSRAFLRVCSRKADSLFWANSEIENGAFVFKSFNLEDSTRNGVFHELYFGEFPRVLAESGKKVVFLVDPLIPLRSNLRAKGEIAVVSIYRYLCVLRLFRVYFTHIFRCILDRSLVGREISDPGSFLSRVYLECFRSFFSKSMPAAVFYTYENNPWERMLNLAKGGVKTVGLQHVPAAPAHLNYHLDSIARVHGIPNFLLTLGPSSSRQFISDFGFPADRVIDGKGFKFRTLATAKPREIHKIRKILVALGVADSRFLAEYFLKHQEIFKINGLEIVFRFHPAFGPDVMGIPPSEWHLISNRTLAEDLSEVDAVFYWGSGVALEALAVGLPSVYLAPKDERLSNDILFDCDSNVIKSSETVSPGRILNQLDEMIGTGFLEKQTMGINYVRERVSVFDPITDQKWASELVEKLVGSGL